MANNLPKPLYLRCIKCMTIGNKCLDTSLTVPAHDSRYTYFISDVTWIKTYACDNSFMFVTLSMNLHINALLKQALGYGKWKYSCFSSLKHLAKLLQL